MDVSFFARFVDQHALDEFYLEFGPGWKGFFSRIAYARIKEITTEFGELAFYQERAKINAAMLKALSDIFLETSSGALNVTDVQFRKVTIENDLDEAVEDKLIELQAQRKWEIQKNISIIEKDIELTKQYADNNITIIYANATSNATKIIAKAEAEAFQIELEGYAEAFKQLDDEVNFSDDKSFLAFMYAEMFSRVKSSSNVNLGFSRQGVLAKHI